LSGKTLKSFPSKPAWESMHNVEYTVSSISDHLHKEIVKLLGIGTIGRIKRHTKLEEEQLIGHYLYQSKDKNYFLKIENSKKSRQLLEADEICKKILNEGTVNVSTIVDGYPKSFINHTKLFVYDYIDSRFANTSMLDMQNLGKSLTVLHKSLIKLDNKSIKLRTEEREAYFFNRVYNSESKMALLDEDIRNILQKNKLLFQQNFGVRDIIHGDLNFHNIVFDDNNQKVIFLDFEDTVHSFFTPLMDIAMILERYILFRDISNEQKILLCKDFLLHYTNKIVYKQGYLFNILKLISVRSILILVGAFFEHDEYNKSEFTKFKKNLLFIEQNKNLIIDIESIFFE